LGVAAIDEESCNAPLAEMDGEENNPILLVPLIRNPAIVFEDMAEELVAEHDTVWGAMSH